MAVIYANFLNNTVTLRDALNMDATRIIEKFEDIANNLVAYQVQNEAQPHMRAAVDQITNIRSIFENRTRRTRNLGYIVDQNGQLSSLPVAYLGNLFNLRTLYDIIGWILSVVGPIPQTARKDNYYYPLMLIGYAFSGRLIPLPKTNAAGAPGPPEVWSAIWFRQMVGEHEVKRVVVGANLDTPGKDAKNNAKNFRKNLLHQPTDILGLDVNGKSIMQRLRGEAQDFGHCAETYPLLFLFSLGLGQEATNIQKTAEGLAIRAKYLYQSPALTITPYNKASSALMNPCQNCEWLLAYGNGIEISKFLVKNRQL